jgi:hypothetical protein
MRGNIARRGNKLRTLLQYKIKKLDIDETNAVRDQGK